MSILSVLVQNLKEKFVLYIYFCVLYKFYGPFVVISKALNSELIMRDSFLKNVDFWQLIFRPLILSDIVKERKRKIF